MAKLLQRFAVLLVFASVLARADPARFDLGGPRIDIRVTRHGVTLPIAFVPNLQAGDQLWLHPALPASQSVKYLLIAAFLRGSTNPPPDDWFTRIETWKKDVRQEGVTITVPAEAQQAILFLAPETGGDFSTLRSAVRGRPGIFVRASQDLAEAGFEQARIEKYLAELKQVPPSDQTTLQDHSNLLARTLNLRPNPDCAKRPVDQQYTCLTQSGSQMLLDDSHAQTVVAALSSGTNSDFINAASTTGLAGGGTYSAYVGAIVDFVRILSSVHTAQYQYIPAIAFPEQEALNLRLNTAPSFHNPKSVLVVSLPAIQTAVPPPLRPADPNHIACLLQPAVVLPVEGAPLVFSTAFAHDLVLHLSASVPAPEGKPKQDLPLVPDAARGGLVIATSPPVRKELPAAASDSPMAPLLKSGEPLTGTVTGYWGFDRFTGPAVPLQGLPGENWRILAAPDSPANLIAGQPNHLHLLSTGTACVQSITVEPSGKADWKNAVPPTGDTSATVLDLAVNLQQSSTPGPIRLNIQQFGQQKPDQLGTRTFAEPATIEALQVHANDRVLTLSGSSLEQVKQVTIGTSTYAPDSPGSGSSFTLVATKEALSTAFKAGDPFQAAILLTDGRVLVKAATVLPPRPVVALLRKRITFGSPSPIKLTSPDDLPLGATLTFFVKSEGKFPRSQQIEVASLDDSLKTTLNIHSGALVLQDSRTVLATLDPLRTFGTSAFGPLHMRALGADGTAGEWLPLATLVRLPALSDLRCPSDPARPCQLNGTGLYLLDAVSGDPTFKSVTAVPEAFAEGTIAVPHPVAGSFYLRLRDDPETTNQVTMPILPEAPASQ